MSEQAFFPHHINATNEDFLGNNGIGRYIFFPGSDGRAMEIAQRFENLKIKKHARGHHLYLGTLKDGDKTIDVAAISSGMGCPSLEIIMHELFHLGAKRFLRVGSAGTLQRDLVKIGDYVNAQASVRDENTTTDYVPTAVPAIASYEFVAAINTAAKNHAIQIATGIVHSKSSFYAREFGAGPNGAANIAYIDMLRQCGILASEMETSALFIQSHLYNHRLRQQGIGCNYSVLAGAILGILAMPPEGFATAEQASTIITRLIDIAIESVKILAANER